MASLHVLILLLWCANRWIKCKISLIMMRRERSEREKEGDLTPPHPPWEVQGPSTSPKSCIVLTMLAWLIRNVDDDWFRDEWWRTTHKEDASMKREIERMRGSWWFTFILQSFPILDSNVIGSYHHLNQLTYKIHISLQCLSHAMSEMRGRAFMACEGPCSWWK